MGNRDDSLLNQMFKMCIKLMVQDRYDLRVLMIRLCCHHHLGEASSRGSGVYVYGKRESRGCRQGRRCVHRIQSTRGYGKTGSSSERAISAFFSKKKLKK